MFGDPTNLIMAFVVLESKAQAQEMFLTRGFEKITNNSGDYLYNKEGKVSIHFVEEQEEYAVKSMVFINSLRSEKVVVFLEIIGLDMAPGEYPDLTMSCLVEVGALPIGQMSSEYSNANGLSDDKTFLYLNKNKYKKVHYAYYPSRN